MKRKVIALALILACGCVGCSSETVKAESTGPNALLLTASTVTMAEEAVPVKGERRSVPVAECTGSRVGPEKVPAEVLNIQEQSTEQGLVSVEPVADREPIVAETIADQEPVMTENQLIIPSAGISVTYAVGNHSQSSVDANDVVLAQDIYDYDGTVRFFGHVTRTFQTLKNTAVGDIITISGTDGTVRSYRVVFSGTGMVSDDNTNIISDSDGSLLLGQGYAEFITCHNTAQTEQCRWVVLAVPM